MNHASRLLGIYESKWLTAVSTGDIETIKKLLKKVNVNTQKDCTGSSALCIAARKGETNMVKILLTIPGININAQNRWGQTALMIAARDGYDSIVKLLLEMPNIYINLVDEHNMTALKYAQKDYFFEIAKLIRDKISELTNRAFDAIKQNNITIFKTVIRQIGADLVDCDGKCLIDKACAANKPKIIFFLLQNAEDPRELLARFPFESLNPSSDLFKYFFDLAYCNQSKTKTKKTGFKKPTWPTFSGSLKLSKQITNSAQNKAVAKPCHVCTREATQFCGTCKKVYYCSERCQKADWKFHKLNCKT